MDLAGGARDKLSTSPSSVRDLNKSPEEANHISNSAFQSSRFFKTQERGLEVTYGWQEKSFRHSPKTHVSPFRYRPISAQAILKDQNFEAPITHTGDRLHVIPYLPKSRAASIEEKEFYIHPTSPKGHLNIPCVPDFNASCSTLDFTLDGDQWVDKRKMPATNTKRSGRRPTRQYRHEMETPSDQKRIYDTNNYSTDKGHIDSEVRIIQRMPHKPEPKGPNVVKIEVAPGEFMRLRGASETWRAIKFDFYMPCVCICCNLTLFCIQDAIFVICPACHVVSPLEGVLYDGYDGGVGLGFTIEELSKWQQEIAFGRPDANAGSISNYAQR